MVIDTQLSHSNYFKKEVKTVEEKPTVEVKPAVIKTEVKKPIVVTSKKK
jgi:hypothetical protein